MEPKTIGAAKFKEQCLGLTDGLAPEGLVITRGADPLPERFLTRRTARA